jgi:hypothetical protein
VALISDGNLIIEGSITAIGGGGGSGGRAPSWYISGGNGGGGGGGGVLLYGKEVLVPGRVDVRGREGNGISSVNGGTVKIFYETNMTYGTIRAGRLYSNGRPLMQGLEHPLDNGSSLLRPEFRWWSAIDPEGDNISYQIQVAIWPDFKMPLVDIDGLRLYNFAPADDLLGKEFFWRVRATDAIGYGNWSETRRFHNDISAPVTSIDPLPVYVNRTSFLVSWTGSDDVTGIAKYRIYVAEGKSPFRVWLYDVNYTSAVYEGAKEGFKYSFFSEGIDRAGNNESARMTADACTTVDCTPPVSSVDSVSYGDAPGEIVVRWSGSDSTSGIREYNVFISEDGETFNVWQLATTDTSAPFLGGDALEYSFYCTACDNAGNVENATDGTRILKLRADRSAPVTALSLTGTSFGQEPVYVALSTMFILSAADNCSGVKETWFALDDGKPKPFLSSFTSKSPGIHSLGYWSVDIAGNAEKTNKMEFFVDDEAPETTVDVGGPNLSATGKIFLSGNCSIILLANDNASGVARTEYNLDNHGYMEYVRLFGLDMAGKHTLLYRSVDNVGNMEVDQSVQIVVDIQPPTTKAVTDALLSNVDIRILFNANDSESGVMCTYYRITREKLPFGEYQTGNEAVILAEEDHSSDANYSIQYYSVDKLGNKETAREFKVRIDTQVFLQLGFKGVPKVGIDRYSIQGRTEPGARMSINDEVVFLSSDGGFTYDVGLRPGRNKATITIIDLAGNTLTRTVNIDYEQRVDTTGWWIVAIAIAVVTGIITIAGVFVAKRAKRNIKLKKRRRLKHSSMQSKTRGNNKPKINRSP